MFYIGFYGFLCWALAIYCTSGFSSFFSYSSSLYQGIFVAVLTDLTYAFLLLAAYQQGNSGFVGLISYMTILYGSLCDYFFF